MSLEAGRDGLYSSFKKLQAHWDITDPHWQDAMKIEFVKDTFTPLQNKVTAALAAIGRMETILHQMRIDCEGQQYDIYAAEESGDW